RRRELYQTWSVLLGLVRGQMDPMLVREVMVETLMRVLRQRLRLDRPVPVLRADPVLLVQTVVDPRQLGSGLLDMRADRHRPGRRQLLRGLLARRGGRPDPLLDAPQRPHR